MSQVKKLAGETVIYGLGSILPKVLNFLLLAPYLTRVLDKENFGIHGILYAYVALLISLFTLRLETAYFRFATLEKDSKNAYASGFTTILIFSTLCAFLIFMNAQVIASWLTGPEDARYIRWFSLILLFDALAALPFARLRLENKAIKFSAIKIINVLVSAVLILSYLSVFPALENPGVLQGFPFYYSVGRELDYVFLANLVASIVVLVLLLPQLIKVRLHIDKALMKKMLMYSIPLILVGIAAAINQVFDRVFVSQLLPSADALETSGAYNGAAKVAVIMSLFATAFNYAAEPFFFKSFKDKDSTQLYAYVLKAFTIAGLVVFLTIAIFLDQAMLLIGKDYRGVSDIVPILLMAYLFLGIYYNISIWYKLKDKTYMGALIAITGAIITIMCNVILIPKIGYIGAAWSALICYIFMCIFAYTSGKRNLAIPYDIKNLSIYFLLAISFYFISLWIGQSGLHSIAQLVLKGLLVIAFMAYAFIKDRQLLKL
ncbi:oligosaccharide flippase family protein [Portibacter lacus]|uniref:Polysaccharide biosynthesis protein n=1 Tax=Portibacter lacus TaxID=1099794 RepID=A0AA37WGS8_9BACT|nr:oligosaccharide flippase family protein [Portibacter lacus]GLR18090.1 polysaccharide biosynthesis protein [Portibacter lacus]